MIGAVVFDVGGVLCPCPVNEFGRVDAEHGLPEGTVESFIRGGSLFAQCETGRLPIAEFFARCVETIEADHGVAVDVRRLELMMERVMGESSRPGMLALVGELRAAGLQLGLLTNIFAERREWLHALFPEGTIDVYCDSSEVGLRKPDPAIYRKLLELLDRPGEEVAFVDDFAENVIAAQELGIHGILFEDEAQVRRELIAAGVDIDDDVLEVA